MLAYFGEFYGCIKGRHAAGRPARFMAVALLSGVFLACAAARSADGGEYTHTWTGGDGDGVWENPGNWEQPTYPDGAGDAALIDSGADGIATAGDLTLGALTLDPGFTGTVTLGGTLTITDTGGKSGDLNVNAGTLRTHTSTAAADAYSGNITVSGTFTIGEDGVVVVRRSSTAGEGTGQTIAAGDMVVDGVLHANGQGFGNGQGPGGGSGNSAGSYGGRGGRGSSGTPGNTYGYVTSPSSLGSGGGGEAGGGAIIIDVKRKLTVTGAGIVSANGDGGSWPASGAGGSVRVTAAELAGSGIIRANGGSNNNNSRSAGGGGRVAIMLGSGTSFDDVNIQAYGGAGATEARHGAAGTVYLETADHDPERGELVVDNNGTTVLRDDTFTELTSGGETVHNFSRLAIRRGWNLSIRKEDTLDFGKTVIEGDSAATAFVTISSTDGIKFPEPFVLVEKCTLNLDVPIFASGDWIVPANAILSHNHNLSEEKHKLELTLSGNLTIQQGGGVDVSSKGFAAGHGPGAGTGNSGGSHGGSGGIGTSGVPGNTYGSAVNPVSLGSGSAQHSGGGAIIINVSGTVTLDGFMNADGNGGTWRPSGAGGTVNIIAADLAGSGTIRANGSFPTTSQRAAGGGGRVSVILNTGTSFDNFNIQNIQAYGETGDSTARNAAAGTVYLQHAGHAPGAGELLVSSLHGTDAAQGIVTHLPAMLDTELYVDELRTVTLIVKDEGVVGLTADITVGDLVFE